VIIFNFIILFLTYLLLIFSPIFYGSVLDWSQYSIQLIIYVILSVWLLQIILTKDTLKINYLKIAPVLLLVLLTLFQTLSLPDIILKIFSNNSFELWDNSRRLLFETGFEYNKDKYSISIYPYATSNSFYLLMSYCAFGFFVSKYFNNRFRVILLLIPILIVSFLEALLGIYQSIIAYGISSSQGAHGTYVNRNHYVGILELTTPLIMGYALSYNKFLDTGIKSILRSIKNSDEFFKQLFVLIFVIILFIAIFLSKSRMGILSISLALIFFYMNITFFAKPYKNISIFIMIILVFFAFLLLFLDINPVFERFKTLSKLDQRIYVWKDCLNIIKDFPLFGSGLGTFEFIYPLYKENLKLPLKYTHAHNDYIQILVEIGILGFSCVLAGLIILFKDIIAFLNYNIKNKITFNYFITLGAATGILSLLIHSFADFNLYIPANAIYFTTLIGIVYGINSEESRLSKSSRKISRNKKYSNIL